MELRPILQLVQTLPTELRPILQLGLTPPMVLRPIPQLGPILPMVLRLIQVLVGTSQMDHPQVMEPSLMGQIAIKVCLLNYKSCSKMNPANAIMFLTSLQESIILHAIAPIHRLGRPQ